MAIKLSFQNKVMASVVTAVAVLVFVSSLILVRNIQQSSIRVNQEIHHGEALRSAALISAFLDDVEIDILTIAATPPIRGVMRTRDSETGIDPFDGSTYDLWTSRLEQIFSGYSNAGYYYMLRYIDESGQELVRVQFEDGNAKIVSGNELQNKSGSNYVVDTLLLNPGEIHVTQIELNREGVDNAIEEPFTPVLRVSTPVFDSAGNVRGLIVGNVFSSYLEAIVDTSEGETYLINPDGSFALHPDSSKEFGGPIDLATGYSFNDEFSRYAPILASGETLSDLKQGDLYSLTPITDPISSQWRFYLLHYVPRSVLVASTTRLIVDTLSLYFFSALVFLFIVYLFTGRIVKPLRAFTGVANLVTKGDYSKRVDIDSQDEVGDLARAFNAMLERVKETQADLSKQVQEKTEALKKALSDSRGQNDELRDTQVAVTNVLEDVEEERKRVEEVKQKQSVLLSVLTSVVWSADSKGAFVEPQKDFQEFTGMSWEEAKGFGWADAIHSDDRKRVVADWQRSLASGKPFFAEGRMWFGKEGTYHYFTAKAAPIKNSKGEVKEWIGTVNDIHARKTRELEIEREKERSETLAADLEKFKLAVEGTSDQVVITDPNGMVLFANKATERMTGYSVKDVLGKKAGSKELWGGQMENAFYEQMWHTLTVEKKTFGGRITNKKKSGEAYIVQSSISPIVNGAGDVEFFIAIEKDITQEALVDKAKTEFVSLASHQLRTPLTAINWYVEILLSGDAGELTDDQKKYLREVYAGNQRMVDLVNALLNVSRLELGTFAVDPEPVVVKELAETILGEVKPQITERKQTLRTHFDEALPTIQADRNLLGIVFQNLLSNAVKYTPEGGSVALDVALDKQTSSIRIKVADTGMGIPKHQQDKIFSKLFRADNAKNSDTQGTGLGLYIVKAIIEQAGGTITFESEEGKGTTFIVTLPLDGMKKKEGSKTIDKMR